MMTNGPLAKLSDKNIRCRRMMPKDVSATSIGGLQKQAIHASPLLMCLQKRMSSGRVTV